MKWLARRRLKALDALVTGRRERDTRMGLVIGSVGDGPALAYKVAGGFGYRWMPAFVQRAIVHVWNPVVCRFWGHYELDEKALGGPSRIVCVNCSKEWPI